MSGLGGCNAPCRWDQGAYTVHETLIMPPKPGPDDYFWRNAFAGEFDQVRLFLIGRPFSLVGDRRESDRLVQ